MTFVRARDVVATIIGAAVAAFLTMLFDWFFGRMADYYFFSTLSYITPNLGPIWLALPRVLIFLAVGFFFGRVFFKHLAVGIAVYVPLVSVYFYSVRIGDRFWIANDFLAYFIAYFPFAIIPVAFAVGLYLYLQGRKGQQRLKGQPGRMG